jgi:hypothetical protein
VAGLASRNALYVSNLAFVETLTFKITDEISSLHLTA